MWNFIASAVLSVIVSITGAWGVYNYAPLSFFDGQSTPSYGSTITTIAGSDTLSNSRSTINTNFTNLNTSKAEISDVSGTTTLSSLASIGTITTGTWNGSIIGATYGGTGSSTLSSNQVILGNGTGAVKVVSGLGTSGQFLTSGGAGVAPTWTTSSVDQGIAYNWTGLHNFSGGLTSTGTTTVSASSLTTNPFVLNSLGYKFPATRGASSTVLMEDGSGTLMWGTVPRLVYLNTSTVTINSSTASTTIFAFTIPANTLKTANVLVMDIMITGLQLSSTDIYFELGLGTASTTFSQTAEISQADTGHMIITLVGNGATNSQKMFMTALTTNGFLAAGPADVNSMQSSTLTYAQDSTANLTYTLVARTTVSKANAWQSSLTTGTYYSQ